MTRAIRVLIVDDSAFVRRALMRMLSSNAEIEVVGTASDGLDGIEQVKALRPDVVTLDIKMPRMSGLEALRHIMQECPVPVLLLSSLTTEGADITLRGLELGAMDFIDKTSVQGHMNLINLAEELVGKIRALAGVPRSRLMGAAAKDALRVPIEPVKDRRIEVVCIGTSTGGPTALQAIIPRFPENLSTAVLVVQHMPVGFTRSLAERLNGRSLVSVREASDGEPVVPGHVYVAPAGQHMKVRKHGSVRVWLDDEPRNVLHRPSVDVLMQSVAKVYGNRAVGVLLTGMGSDGVEGMRAIRSAGGRTLAESEESCVIYGMPKAAAEAGVVDRAVPLARMADEILQEV
ncbi:MAG: chemotaxis response regulator protein-glutamate methylesterase [Vicinamibacteria bacterium]|nr:chemotaxis response regulator protein-glutamate methylesterase [Vicinamibacteria bacterium]